MIEVRGYVEVIADGIRDCESVVFGHPAGGGSQ